MSPAVGQDTIQALIRQQNPIEPRNPDGAFDLIRIGDAVHSRNIHAGIYDGLRYGVLF